MALDFNQENFKKEVLKVEGLVVVDFWAPWCPPCRLLKPIVEELANLYQGKIKIGKLNIDENRELAQEYEVMSIPTLIFFKEGKVVARLLGAQPKEIIKEKIDSLSYD